MSNPNYFKILDLPVKLKLDHNELKKNYFNLLKEHSNDPILDPNGARNEKKIKLIEAAYTTLKDRITRIEHLLKVEGVDPANDNKPPVNFKETAKKIDTLLAKAPLTSSAIATLKKLHPEVVTEFSSISIDLAKLEDAWDENEDKDLLRRLKRKSAAFSYIRAIDQNIRAILSS